MQRDIRRKTRGKMKMECKKNSNNCFKKVEKEKKENKKDKQRIIK